MAISRRTDRRLLVMGGKEKRRKYSSERLRAFKAKRAARTAAKVQTAMDEIMKIYEPDWPFVPADPRTKRKTMSGIALWLARSGLVTGFNDDARILNVLKTLARKGTIKLPKKTTSGGAHKKK